MDHPTEKDNNSKTLESKRSSSAGDDEDDNSNDSSSRCSGDFKTDESAKQPNKQKKMIHNALERKRRDHIKDMFCTLREVVPTIENDKESRADILKKSCDYLTTVRESNAKEREECEHMRKCVETLEAAVEALKKDNCFIDDGTI